MHVSISISPRYRVNELPGYRMTRMEYFTSLLTVNLLHNLYNEQYGTFEKISFYFMSLTHRLD